MLDEKHVPNHDVHLKQMPFVPYAMKHIKIHFVLYVNIHEDYGKKLAAFVDAHFNVVVIKRMIFSNHCVRHQLTNERNSLCAEVIGERIDHTITWNVHDDLINVLHINMTLIFWKYLKFYCLFLDLFTMHEGRCRRMDDPCPEKLKYTKTPSPVCGSDKRSYVSYDSLICAKYRISKGIFLNKKKITFLN